MKKAYFSFSTKDILANEESYRQIIKTIQLNSFELSRDWLDSAISLLEKKQEQLSRAKLYQDIMSAIKISDICIFDVTVKSMGVGQQIMHALDKGKPVLVVSNETAEIPLDKLLISGSRSGLLELASYKNLDDLRSTVEKFLNKRGRFGHTRLNLSIDSHLIDYVEWRSFKDNSTKTDVIREAIEKKLKDDVDYKN